MMGLLLLCEAFEGAHRWFGRSIVAAVIVVIAGFRRRRGRVFTIHFSAGGPGRQFLLARR